MKNLGNFSALLLIVTIGCVVTYNQPITTAPIIAKALHFSKDEIKSMPMQFCYIVFSILPVVFWYSISYVESDKGSIRFVDQQQ